MADPFVHHGTSYPILDGDLSLLTCAPTSAPTPMYKTEDVLTAVKPCDLFALWTSRGDPCSMFHAFVGMRQVLRAAIPDVLEAPIHEAK